jgi:hypothetical protein
MKSKICVGEICGTRQMNMLKERLKVGLVVILRDDVLGRPLHPPTATGDDALAGGFDAQDDESVLTREFVLCQQFATATAARLLLLLVGGRRRGDERGGHSERLGVAGRPGVAVRVELAFATGPGSVPDHLLRPDNVVEDVAVVETVNVVSLLTGSRGEFAGPPAAEQIVPRPEQHLTLVKKELTRELNIEKELKIKFS